jgi:hypothetical protein
MIQLTAAGVNHATTAAQNIARRGQVIREQNSSVWIADCSGPPSNPPLVLAQLLQHVKMMQPLLNSNLHTDQQVIPRTAPTVSVRLQQYMYGLFFLTCRTAWLGLRRCPLLCYKRRPLLIKPQGSSTSFTGSPVELHGLAHNSHSTQMI